MEKRDQEHHHTSLEDAAMRWFLTLFLFVGWTMVVNADTFVYVSMASEQKIQVYRMNADDGKLTPVETFAVDGAPGALAVYPAGRAKAGGLIGGLEQLPLHLFASLRSNNSLASYAIDRNTGKLKHVSSVSLPKGENAAFVGTDRTGRWLISASYSGGKVVVHEIDKGKIKSPPVQTVTTAVTAHAFATDPDNFWVFVPHVTPNAIFQFRLDANTGMLTDFGKAAGGAPKAGPRHLAWHPTRKMAFSSDETGNSITAYHFNSKEGLKPHQTLSTLPTDFKGKNTTAEVKVHPSGKFAWVSNRGHDSLAGFKIDDKGDLTAIGQTPTEKTPRSFEIDPDGRYVFGAGEGSGKLAVFRVDTDKGSLTRIHTYEVGKSLTWVMAVKMK
jgi:6-phosphogluconolactonase